MQQFSDSSFAIGLGALGVGVIPVIVHALRCRRPLASPPVDLATWFSRWQVQHNAPDIDPSQTTALRLFLTLTYRAARPLARRGLSPTTVTLAGLWLAFVVPVITLRSPLIAAVICLLSATLDGVDGAVAGLSGRATRTGFVLDSVVDRLAEVAFFLALVAVGGHVGAAAAGWAGVVLLEYTRARAGNAGLGEVGVVTVAERPTRVLCVVFGLLGAWLQPDHATVIADSASLLAALTAGVGIGQLAQHIHRRFTDASPPDRTTRPS